MVRDANDRILEQRIIGSRGYVVVAFFMRESIPCDHFRPEYENVASMIEGDIEFWRIDAMENPEITDTLGITACPTTLLFRDVEEIRRFEGPYSRETLRDRLKDAMVMGK